MKNITFTAAGQLAGLANLLMLHGYETGDTDIALGMEAPWLFIREAGQYLAGTRLYTPKWLNLYLLPRGFRMEEIVLPRDEVPAFLRCQRSALLPVKIVRDSRHPVVFSGYSERRYHFINVKRADSPEPERLSLTTAMLKRRLSDAVPVRTLTQCSPQSVDFTPLLLDSLRNLDAYWADFLLVHHRIITRSELRDLHRPVFRALMQDLLPLSILAGDYTLAEELRQLNHDYRHIFTHNSPETVPLYEKLPKSSVKKCILWLKEDIIDRLYALGASDELVEEYMQGQK